VPEFRANGVSCPLSGQTRADMKRGLGPKTSDPSRTISRAPDGAETDASSAQRDAAPGREPLVRRLQATADVRRLSVVRGRTGPTTAQESGVLTDGESELSRPRWLSHGGLNRSNRGRERSGRTGRGDPLIRSRQRRPIRRGVERSEVRFDSGAVPQR
jgi:hypothetical protein